MDLIIYTENVLFLAQEAGGQLRPYHIKNDKRLSHRPVFPGESNRDGYTKPVYFYRQPLKKGIYLCDVYHSKNNYYYVAEVLSKPPLKYLVKISKRNSQNATVHLVALSRDSKNRTFEYNIDRLPDLYITGDRERDLADLMQIVEQVSDEYDFEPEGENYYYEMMDKIFGQGRITNKIINQAKT